MAFKLFGYTLSKEGDINTDGVTDHPSFVNPSSDDGSATVIAGGYFGTYMDIDGNLRTENDFIRRYREMALQPEVDSAVEDIVNEAIIVDDDGKVVDIKLDALEDELSDSVRKEIADEFENVLKLLHFTLKGHDLFRRWYIDGRLYYHKILDPKNPKNGVQELRYIDPRKIKKIREVKRSKDAASNAEIVTDISEYYIFNEKGLISTQPSNVSAGTMTTQGIKIPVDAITFVPSGYMDMDKNVVISYLHKAIKPVNQLRMVEDAMVIYILSRAPERRIFYIDVGNLPKVKAEQYMKEMMNKYRNKVVYDASTGEIRDDKKYLSMLEDFWLPRRDGKASTEITTLQGAERLTDTANIEYYQKKVYQALNVPPSRLRIDDTFNFERGQTITRDELKFAKFIDRLRNRFSELFLDVLRTNLLLKKVMNEDDWAEIKDKIKFDYKKDIYYAEMTTLETERNRVDLLTLMVPFIGTFYSTDYLKKNVLFQDDETIKEIAKANDKEQQQAIATTGNAMAPGDPPVLPQQPQFPGAAPGQNPTSNPPKQG